MTDSHHFFIGLAYSLTALGVMAECLTLWIGRRKAITKVKREFDLDEAQDSSL